MGLLPAGLLTELQKPAVRCNFLLEIGDDIQISSDGVSSLSLGYYAPWITNWGTLSRTLSGWRGGLTAPTLSVDVDDVGGQFSRLYGRNLRGQTVTAKLAGAGVYFSWFSGVVDGITKSGSKLSIKCRQDDDRLTLPLTKAPIRHNTYADLPAKSDAVGKGAPYAIGSFDSTALSALGMLKCPYVDGTERRYLVSLGWWQTVLRVFSANVLKADPADYAIVQTLSGDSRKVTLIDFVDDQGENEVVVDVQDLVSPTGPMAVLRQILVDLAWNDYHTASFDASSAPLDADFTDADGILETALGLSCSYYIPPDRATTQQIIKHFGDSYEVLFGWTYLGKLKPFVWEWRTQNADVYSSRRVLTDADYLSDPEFSTDPESNVTRLLGKSGKRPADGNFQNQRTVLLETDEGQERAATTEMPALPATVETIAATAYLTPDGTTSAGAWSLGAGASLHAAIADAPPDHSDGDATYDSVDSVSNPTPTTLRVSLSAMTASVVAITSIEIIVEASGVNTSGADDETVALAPYIGGTLYGALSVPLVGIGGYYARYVAGVWSLNPATGLPWTVSDLNSLQMALSWDAGSTTAKEVRVSQAYVKVNYVPAANVSPANLSVLSRRANRYGRRASEILKVEAPLEFMDFELADDISVSDSREGWGFTSHERMSYRVLGIDVMPSRYRVRLILERIREQLTTYWLWGKSLVAVDGSSAAGDGMAFLNHGGEVTVDRASVKCLDDPAGIDVQDAGPVAQVLNNCWPSDRYGTLIERAGKNWQKRSSFVSQLTGWTQSAGDGTIEADATAGEQLFADAAVSAYHLKVTAGSPHTVESRVTGTATDSITVADGQIVALSLDHKCSTDTAGDGWAFRLQRGVDSNYYDADAETWGASPVDNPIPPVTSWDRYKLTGIDIGGSNTTLTVSLAVLSGATADSVARAGHVQIEQGYWVSSRIVTDAASVTRAADDITIENDKSDGVTTYHAHPQSQGTWVDDVVSQWTSPITADPPGAPTDYRFYLHVIETSDGMTSSGFSTYYIGTDETWNFRVLVEDVEYIASVEVPMVAGRRYRVISRWTGPEAELGLTAGTATCAVIDDTGAVVRTDVVFGTGPVIEDGANLSIGSAAGEQHFDGYVVESRVSPHVFTDEELEIA